MSDEWIATRVSALIALWDEGLPASEIGRRLGVSKNAVVGKVHRLGLTKRQSPILKKPKENAAVAMESLTAGMCNWPSGHPGTDEFGFCGGKSVPGKPYCAEHCAMAYLSGTREKKAEKAA